ncbi:hypothetical protein D9M72_653410 [compost metagenome]
MQDGQFFATAFVRSVDGFLNLFRVRHAGRNNHGFARTGDVFNERNINGFKRCNFVSWSIQIFQQINGGIVKRRTEDGNSVFTSVRK